MNRSVTRMLRSAVAACTILAGCVGPTSGLDEPDREGTNGGSETWEYVPPPGCGIIVETDPGFSQVSGQVLTRRWEPAANVTVHAQLQGDGSPSHEQARADARGCYYFVLPSGTTWTLTPVLEGFEPEGRAVSLCEDGHTRDDVDLFLTRLT